MTSKTVQHKNPRLELLEKLDETILLLASSEHIKLACEQFRDAIGQSTGARSVDAERDFEKALKPLTTLVKTADVIDPHILTAEELTSLGHSPTDELARDALTKGALRERRMLLQAAEANTNRRIAWYAIAAIGINACATLVAALI